MGACPECDGLGHIEFFDPKRIVAFPNLSLASGAIKGWDRRNQFYFQMLTSIAAYYGFDLDVPFEQLDDKAQQAVLYGSGRQTIPFAYVNERGRTVVKEHTFEGVVNNLQRRYRETDSMAVKEELAKFINEKQCPSCHGARLRVEARYVKVGSGKQQRHLRSRCHAAAGDPVLLRDPEADRCQEGNRRSHHQGNRLAPDLPQQRRPGLSLAGTQRRYALGR